MKRRLTLLARQALDAVVIYVALRIGQHIQVDVRAINDATQALTLRLAQEIDSRHQWQKQAAAYEKIAECADKYLSDVPITRDEVPWSDDDRRQLTTFLETTLAGKKLVQHLANRLGDYERAAVLYATADNAVALLKRAHGFRDCRGEIIRLSAAGPSPANHEAQDIALPADLDHLRA